MTMSWKLIAVAAGSASIYYVYNWMSAGKSKERNPTDNVVSNERVTWIKHFIQASNELKRVERSVRIGPDKSSRFETTAEHSWHLSLLFMAVEKDLPSGLDRFKLLKMLIIHDLPEVLAGDVRLYDQYAKGDDGSLQFNDDSLVENDSVILDKKAREQAAAAKLFAILPDDKREEFTALWQEFEEKRTQEALYARAMDKLHPLIQNSVSSGTDYMDCNATYKSEMALLKKNVLCLANPLLSAMGIHLLEEARAKKWIQ